MSLDRLRTEVEMLSVHSQSPDPDPDFLIVHLQAALMHASELATNPEPSEPDPIGMPFPGWRSRD